MADATEKISVSIFSVFAFLFYQHFVNFPLCVSLFFPSPNCYSIVFLFFYLSFCIHNFVFYFFLLSLFLSVGLLFSWSCLSVFRSVLLSLFFLTLSVSLLSDQSYSFYIFQFFVLISPVQKTIWRKKVNHGFGWAWLGLGWFLYTGLLYYLCRLNATKLS